MIFRVRPIPSCPGYFVSDTGRVWSPRKELKLQPDKDGYLRFAASTNAWRDYVYVHHVVAEAFLGPKPAAALVCHRNDVPADNRAENVYYGTAQSNRLDCFRNGRQSHEGERNPNAKLTRQQVDDIRRRYAVGGVSHKQLAAEYGVAYHTVYQVVRKLRWAV